MYASRPEKPPQSIQESIAKIVSLLEGQPDDLSTLELDLSGVPDFHRRVYQVTRSIPPGSTLSYGEVAARVGEAGAARAVGQALGENPIPLIIPCHRVVASGGKIGGFSGGGGASTKRRLLAIESRNSSVLE